MELGGPGCSCLLLGGCMQYAHRWLPLGLSKCKGSTGTKYYSSSTPQAWAGLGMPTPVLHSMLSTEEELGSKLHSQGLSNTGICPHAPSLMVPQLFRECHSSVRKHHASPVLETFGTLGMHPAHH